MFSSTLNEMHCMGVSDRASRRPLLTGMRQEMIICRSYLHTTCVGPAVECCCVRLSPAHLMAFWYHRAVAFFGLQPFVSAGPYM